MKKVMVTIVVMLLCCGILWPGIARAGEVSLTILGTESFDWTQASVTGRLGYVHQDCLEPFVGVVCWPNFKVNEAEGEKKIDYAFAAGVAYHWIDLVDPENPLPWIPDILLTMIPENFEARPYICGQCLFKKDEGALGGIIGLRCKPNPEDTVCIKFEVQGHNTFRDLAAMPEDLTFYFGFELRR